MVSGIGSSNQYVSFLQMAAGRQKGAGAFKSADSDGSGGVSQTELETFIQNLTSQTGDTIDTTNAISTYDTNGDGVLSQDEFNAFMKANVAPHHGMMGMGHGHRHGGGLFKALDTDSSGGISQSELDNWAQQMSAKTGQSIDVGNAVTTYDADGSGELSQDELKSFLDASGGIMPPPPGDMGSAGEVNSAGTSSTATNADSIISQYDTNGDGMLSSSELQAYLDNSNTTALSALVQQAFSAYAMNSGSGQAFGLEQSLMGSGGSNAYFPIDTTA